MRKLQTSREATKTMTRRTKCLETVDLIASGYEWTCPKCETTNEEIGVTGKVICRNCHRTFKVQYYDHAIG